MDRIAAAGAGVALLVAVVLLGWLLARDRRARRRLEILGEVAAADTAGPIEETLARICDILVPGIADFCMIDVIDEDGSPRRAAVRAAPGGSEGVERWLARRPPSAPAWMNGEPAEEAPRPRVYERFTERDLGELAHDPADLEFLRRLEMRSAVTVALTARGRVTGSLTIAVSWSNRRYRREDARFAWILSGRIALALDNSGLFANLERAERDRAEIAATLQHGLLPPPLPHIPAWSLAAMYRPAGDQNEVGGDFYDVFRVPGGWMLAIGDVTGNGAAAASVTAVVRYTLRTAAMLSDDPVVALRILNRALLQRGDAALCSLVSVTLGDAPGEPLRIAVAGHPPPLLVEPGGVVSEVATADPVLGAFPDAEWAIAKREMAPGSELVIVTDGFIECRGGEERFGEERLRRVLGESGGPPLAVRRLEAAVEEFAGDHLDDDMAALAIGPVVERDDAAAEPVALSSPPKVASLDDIDV